MSVVRVAVAALLEPGMNGRLLVHDHCMEFLLP